MAGVAFGSTLLGGATSLATAVYQTSSAFAARHETTHAQQIETTKQYIAEFESAYIRNEVSEEDWRQYLILREKARENEKIYEDSINEYKDTSAVNFVQKWKLKRRVRKQKKELRLSNRSLRSHYDSCSSDASDASSTTAEHGSPPRNRDPYNNENSEHISNWAKDVASLDPEDEPLHRDHRCMNVLKGTQDCFASLSFSSDSDRVVSGSWDGGIQIWDVQAEEISVGPMRGHTGRVESVSFSPDGRKIVSGSADRTLRIWDAQTGVCIVGPLGGHTERVTSVAFAPNQQIVASGSDDKTIRVWDAQTGAIIAGPLKGHADLVQFVVFSPDSKRVASTSVDGSIRVWDVSSGVTVLEPFQDYDIPLISAVFHLVEKCLLTISANGFVSGWNTETGEMLFLKRISSSLTYAAFSADGNFIVSGSQNFTISVANTFMGGTTIGPLVGHTGNIESVAISQDGKRVASGSCDSTMRIWDAHANGYDQSL
ncbi:hypothetical protein HYPSUDRAFT_220561 [Hypholoma sublateritium FD-334 SS-4]|uniref:Uncharacterized protein n=1 Tax=Hypholoma sublateritium (strain FD-334 SS-4) TaxID=945553 RepID=A0A0D2NCH3_HYPSF|nr:hypothetical protein HYPSUDRAFT_220561 [Hypholoma sublateritium FD-334 SS-4]